MSKGQQQPEKKWRKIKQHTQVTCKSIILSLEVLKYFFQNVRQFNNSETRYNTNTVYNYVPRTLTISQ